MGLGIQTGSGVADLMSARKLKATEHEEQVAVFDWARCMYSRKPELRLLHAIPNGSWRALTTAKRLKREGVMPGVPDMCLPVPRGKWYGLYIELKSSGGRLSKEQKQWMDALHEQGYYTSCCWGAEAAINAIIWYLTGATL
jgi:hypothetical protein